MYSKDVWETYAFEGTQRVEYRWVGSKYYLRVRRIYITYAKTCGEPNVRRIPCEVRQKTHYRDIVDVVCRERMI